MIKGTKDYLDKIAETHHCPEHPKLFLLVAWHQTEGYVIRCGGGHFPDEVNKRLTPAQEMVVDPTVVLPKLVSRLPAKDLGSGELLVPIMVQGLIAYAQKYGLDAYRGHVVLMYGEPYFTIDGYLFYANQQEKPYSLTSLPMDDEQRKLYKVGEEDHAWIGTVHLIDTEQTFTGLGIVTREEMTATSKKDATKLRSPVVAAYPWQLAQKRAEWQALRRAFPIGESKEKEEN